MPNVSFDVADDRFDADCFVFIGSDGEKRIKISFGNVFPDD